MSSILVGTSSWTDKSLIDCGRFYPDAGMALRNWGRRNGYPVDLLESFIGNQSREMMNDFVAVYVKDRAFSTKYPDRILGDFKDYVNGYVLGDSRFSNFVSETEDRKAHMQLKSLKASFKQIVG